MHTIWSNSYDEIEAIADDLREEYPEYDANDLYDMAADLNNEYLDDERDNLNIQLSQSILVIADLEDGTDGSSDTRKYPPGISVIASIPTVTISPGMLTMTEISNAELFTTTA